MLLLVLRSMAARARRMLQELVSVHAASAGGGDGGSIMVAEAESAVANALLQDEEAREKQGLEPEEGGGIESAAVEGEVAEAQGEDAPALADGGSPPAPPAGAAEARVLLLLLFYPAQLAPLKLLRPIWSIFSELVLHSSWSVDGAAPAKRESSPSPVNLALCSVLYESINVECDPVRKSSLVRQYMRLVDRVQSK